MRKTRVAWLAILLACSAPAEEQPEPPQRACTLIGCQDGLSVRVDGATVRELEATAAGLPAQRINCPGGPCDAPIFFPDFTPEEVTLRVTLSNGSVITRTARPAYRSLQPNGPGCPPTCRQGEVVITAGGSGGPGGDAPPPVHPPRPESIVDTLQIEGSPNPVAMRLLRSMDGFPLRFSTYIPANMRGEMLSSGEGDGVHLTLPDRAQGPRFIVFAYPAGTTRAQASSLIRALAQARGAQVTPLDGRSAFAVEGLRYRWSEGRIPMTGWVELGQREDRWFHIAVEYPAEYGDGWGPRVGAFLRHWRWESGESLAL